MDDGEDLTPEEKLELDAEQKATDEANKDVRRGTDGGGQDMDPPSDEDQAGGTEDPAEEPEQEDLLPSEEQEPEVTEEAQADAATKNADEGEEESSTDTKKDKAKSFTDKVKEFAETTTGKATMIGGVIAAAVTGACLLSGSPKEDGILRKVVNKGKLSLAGGNSALTTTALAATAAIALGGGAYAYNKLTSDKKKTDAPDGARSSEESINSSEQAPDLTAKVPVSSKPTTTTKVQPAKQPTSISKTTIIVIVVAVLAILGVLAYMYL